MNTLSHGNCNVPILQTRTITDQYPSQRDLSTSSLTPDGSSVSETWVVPESALEAFKKEQLAAGTTSLLIRFSASLSGTGPFYNVTITKEGLMSTPQEPAYSFDSEPMEENSTTDGFGIIFKRLVKNPTKPSYLIISK